MLNSTSSSVHPPMYPAWERHGGFMLLISFVLWCFFAFELLCNEFFVPALNVMSAKLKLPDDFVGATIMAAGAEAADILTGCVGILVIHSDVGTGTIAGSMLFSMLVIVGASAVAVGTLELDPHSVTRDLLFFVVSLVLLAGSLINGKISVWESTAFVLLYIAYVIVCWYTDRIAIIVNRIRGKETPTEGATALLTVDGEAADDDAQREAETQGKADVDIDIDIDGELEDPDHPHWTASAAGKSAAELAKNAKPRDPVVAQRLSAIAYHEGRVGAPDTAAITGWLHKKSPWYEFARVGSRVWQKRWFCLEESLWYCRNPATPLVRRRVIPVWAVVKVVTSAADPCIFRLHTAEEVYTFRADSAEDALRWSKALRERVRYLGQSSDGEMSKTAIPPGAVVDTGLAGEEDESLLHPPGKEESISQKVLWVITLPFAVLFTFTIPNVKSKRFRKFFLLTFVMVVAWLGVLVYAMVWCADRFAAVVGIPPDLMGLTITGIGASMPSFFGSLIVARQGSAKMAVSSAIGSNTTMILLAFGLPFFIQTAMITPGKDLIVEAGSITTTVVILLGVVVLFTCVSYARKMRLNRVVGISFIGLFVVLLAVVVVLNVLHLNIKM